MRAQKPRKAKIGNSARSISDSSEVGNGNGLSVAQKGPAVNSRGIAGRLVQNFVKQKAKRVLGWEDGGVVSPYR